MALIAVTEFKDKVPSQENNIPIKFVPELTYSKGNCYVLQQKEKYVVQNGM